MKICPQCHKENLENAKFCVYCGFNLTSVAPVASSNAANDQAGSNAHNHSETVEVTPSAATENHSENQQQSTNADTESTTYSTNYAPDNLFNQFMNYLKSSLTNPHNNIEAPKYGGLMSIALYIILMLVIFGLGAKRIVDLIVAQDPNELTVNIFAPIKSAIMQFSGILIVSALAYILVAFAVRRSLLNDNITFLDFTDMFGVYVNISSVLLLLCLILSLFVSVTSSTLMITIVLIFSLSQVVLNYAVVMTLKDIKGRFNNFYSILIAEIVPTIIITWATSVYIQNVYGNLASWISSLGIQ